MGKNNVFRIVAGAIFSAAVTMSCTAAKSKPQNLAEMVSAGRYEQTNRAFIEENLSPIKPERFTTRGLELIHFNKLMSTEEVLAEFAKRGLHSATVEELLAYGAENPDEQKKYDIIALGSSWVDPDGLRTVPFLYEYAGERKLGLCWDNPELQWGKYCRFLASRK